MKEVDGWQDLEGESSTINRFKYEASTQTLAVEFKSGGLYHYFEVPEEVAGGFQASESKGKFLTKSIKPAFRVAQMVRLKDVSAEHDGKVTELGEITVPVALIPLDTLRKIAETDSVVAAIIKSRGL